MRLNYNLHTTDISERAERTSLAAVLVFWFPSDIRHCCTVVISLFSLSYLLIIADRILVLVIFNLWRYILGIKIELNTAFNTTKSGRNTVAISRVTNHVANLPNPLT